MTITESKSGDTLTFALTGRLDTATSPELEAALSGKLDNTSTLVMDLAGLEYISSAGLRVLLSAQKAMDTHGKLILRNVSADVMEVFDITGFSDFLTIE